MDLIIIFVLLLQRVRCTS